MEGEAADPPDIALLEAEVLFRRCRVLIEAMRGLPKAEREQYTKRAEDGLARCLGRHDNDLPKLREAEVLARRSWETRRRAWGAGHLQPSTPSDPSDDARSAGCFVARLRAKQCRATCRALVAQLQQHVNLAESA